MYMNYLMKKRLLVLFLLLLGVPVFSSTNQGIVFDWQTYDAGRIYEGTGSVRAVFHYTNKSDHDIFIKKVKTGCGCTVAKITKKNLKPGESGEVELSVKVRKSRGGVLRQSAYFITEPPVIPRPRIEVQAFVVLDVYLEPKRILLEKVDRDKPVTSTAKILSEKYTNFKIVNLVYNTNTVEVKIKNYQSTNTNIKAFGYILDVTLYPYKMTIRGKRKFFQQKIDIETDIPAMKKKSLYIRGFCK